MKTVANRVLMCGRCGRRTLHHANVVEIRWLMHIAISLLTCGLWAIVFTLVLVFGAVGAVFRGRPRWVCAVCGGEG
jgi:hypothetical protein